MIETPREAEKPPAGDRLPAVVFLYDPRTGAVGWEMPTPGVPLPALIAGLEMCKVFLCHQVLQQAQVRQRQGVVLPDGSPPPPQFRG